VEQKERAHPHATEGRKVASVELVAGVENAKNSPKLACQAPMSPSNGSNLMIISRIINIPKR
jgi:hypothetical protein